MAAITWGDRSMPKTKANNPKITQESNTDNFLEIIQRTYPDLKLIKDDTFYWSPTDNAIHYSEIVDQVDKWSLLHEVGHALCEHTTFKTDFDLLLIEVEAWEKAKIIAEKLKITIDSDHIEDCLDTYRDWLYLRSTCPSCSSTSLQLDDHTYSCINCRQTWQVTKSRQKRCYRKKIK